MTNAEHPSGTRIGKYEIKGRLGKGAMGVVYRAHDSELDRYVALKVMTSHAAAAGEVSMNRFRREAMALARVQHPNVVTVHDLGIDVDGSPYIVMELLDGEDLQNMMRSERLPLDQKIRVVLQVLDGLGHAHAANVVHRDIKPANIFVCANDRVKITDFGLARLAEQTMTLAQMGTPAYMSPEQASETDVDYRSDLFSVGSVFYELLVGRRPFIAETIPTLLHKIVYDVPDFSTFLSGVDYTPLRSVIQRALEKDPARRYQSALEFARELKNVTVIPLPPPVPAPVAAGNVTVVEITDVMGVSYLLREPGVAYSSGFGPSREMRGIKVRRGSLESFLEWARIGSLTFTSRKETNAKGIEVYCYDVTAELTDGNRIVVNLVDDWNMAYWGGGGTGLLFGTTELGDSSVKFSEIASIKVVQIGTESTIPPSTATLATKPT